ncbi:MAG: Modification methylase DpnIIA, partial [Pseudomonadota bacterium]
DKPKKLSPFRGEPKSPIAWVGGKSQLTRTIIPLIPEHTCYVEVFAGAAWVLFRKPESKAEIINDINLDLVTLYRVLQNHKQAFVDYFEHWLVSRSDFERLRGVDPATLTDIQRAARFFYLVKTSFGAKMVKPTFGVARTTGPRLNLLTLDADLEVVRQRLARVYIENRPYVDLIRLHDTPKTFFYLDPPYWDCEDDYGKGLFGKADFERLRNELAGCKAKWLVSINNVPQIRELFKAFNIREVETSYSLSAVGRKPVTELLISNYAWPDGC